MSAAESATEHESFRSRLQQRLRSSKLRRGIKSSRWYWRVKLFLKRLTGRELWLRRRVRLRTQCCDDWQYAPDALPLGAIAYSFGIGESIDFERALIERHAVSVHAFDPTPGAVRWLDMQEPQPGFHFHPWAVAGEDAELTLYRRVTRRGVRSRTMWTADPGQAERENAIVVPAFTVRSIMQRLGHTRVDLLKLDVEGAEYEAIDAMLECPELPGQLLVEFHHRFRGIGKQRTRDCIGELEAAGFAVFAISRTGREVSFIREAHMQAARPRLSTEAR